MKGTISDKRSMRWVRRVVFWIFLSSSLCVLVWVIALTAAIRDKDAIIDEFRREGAATSWQEVVDRERVADKGSGAESFLRAVSTLYGDASCSGLQSPSTAVMRQMDSTLFTPTIDDAVARDLAVGAPAIAVLEQALSKRPGLVSQDLQNARPYTGMAPPRIRDAFNLLNLLRLDVADALGRGHPRRAFHSFSLMLGLGEQLAAEPVYSSQHVRVVLHLTTMEQTLPQILQFAVPNDQEFRRIDDQLIAMEQRFSLARCMLAEGAMYADGLETQPDTLEAEVSKLRRPPEGWSERLQWEFGRRTQHSLLMKPKRIRTLANVLRYFMLASRLVDEPPPLAPEDLRRLHDLHSCIDHPSLTSTMVLPRDRASMAIFSSTSHRQRIAFARISLRVARMAAAKGTLPRGLGEVCDARMPTVPTRWFGGGPPTYGTFDRGFSLSVPVNGMVRLPNFSTFMLQWTVRLRPAAVSNPAK